MPLGDRVDPYLGYNFLVEIQGLIVGGFSEVSGLQAETEIEEIKEGGVNDHIHKVPRMTKHQNVVLKRGLTDSDILWYWHQDVINGKVERKSVFIVILDHEGSEKWRWSFVNAYPIKWTGPELKSDSKAVAIEAIELVHGGFQKV